MNSVPESPARWNALGALTNLFLRRFFENEITGGTQDLAKSAAWLLGFVAAPFTLMPVTGIVRYHFIAITRGAYGLRVLSRPDKTLAITLGMVVAASVAAVVWNSLRLERRDGLVLSGLPVAGRTVVEAKLGALAIYALGLAVGMHGASSLLFGLDFADRAPSLWFALVSPIAHFTATVSACAFVFLSITAIQGVTLALTGPTGFRRVSAGLQVLLVAGIVVCFTKMSAVVHGVAQFNVLPRVLAPAPWLLWAPPVWFLGLYERMLGHADPIFVLLANRALVALAMVTALTLASSTIAYPRVMRQSVEGADDRGGTRLTAVVSEWITRVISPGQVPRAASQFFATSIGRVERLRFVLALTLGVICAWVVPTLAALWLHTSASPSMRWVFALSYVTLVLALVGLRVAVALPADLRATWMFSMVEAPGRRLRSGLWRALYTASVLPVTVAFACVDRWLWSSRVALLHAIMMATLGVLLVEVALWHFDDLPSRRPWRPERANLRGWWFVYGFTFVLIAAGLPQLELFAGGSIAPYAVASGLSLLGALAVRGAHRRPYSTDSFEVELFVEAPGVLKLDI